LTPTARARQRPGGGRSSCVRELLVVVRPPPRPRSDDLGLIEPHQQSVSRADACTPNESVTVKSLGRAGAAVEKEPQNRSEPCSSSWCKASRCRFQPGRSPTELAAGRRA